MFFVHHNIPASSKYIHQTVFATGMPHTWKSKYYAIVIVGVRVILRVPALPPEHSWTRNSMRASTCPQAVLYFYIFMSMLHFQGTSDNINNKIVLVFYIPLHVILAIFATLQFPTACIFMSYLYIKLIILRHITACPYYCNFINHMKFSLYHVRPCKR